MKLLDGAVSGFGPTSDEQRQPSLTQGRCSWWLACDDTQPAEWKMPLIKWSAPLWPKTTDKRDKTCLSEHFPLAFSRALFVSTESLLSSFSIGHRATSTKLWNVIDRRGNTQELLSHATWSAGFWCSLSANTWKKVALHSWRTMCFDYLFDATWSLVNGLDNPQIYFPSKARMRLFFFAALSCLCYIRKCF